MKNIIIGILLIAQSFFISAQVIKNPKISARSDSSMNAQIDQIELTEESTIISFTVRQPKGSTIIIPSDAYIVSSEGGKKLFIQKAVGITINEPLKRTQSSKQSFKLVFPKIENDIKRIDYRDGKEGNNWHFFEIDVDPGDDESGYISAPEKGRILVDGVKWRYINNPSYMAKSGHDFRISKIELSDTETVLYFEITGMFEDYIIVPKESYIQPSEGGEKLYIESAEGTRINDDALLDNTGVTFIKLYFPEIDESVKKINFKALINRGYLSVFELDISMD